MSRPLLTVVCMTIGRTHVAESLRSIRTQAPAADCEILCVGDSHGRRWTDALDMLPALCGQYQALYREHDGGINHYGCPQRTVGQRYARGAWIAYLQDDAELNVGAWDAIQESIAAAPPGPRLFRVETWQPSRAAQGLNPWWTIWQGPRLVEGNVDGDALVVPNKPDQLAPWPTTHYASDFDAIAATVALWRGDVRWEPFVLVRGTPHCSASLEVPT